MKKRVLFFTPYAGRTGSEMMLINMLKHLDQDRFDARLFAMRQGELLSELPSHIPYDVDSSHASLAHRVMDKAARMLHNTGLLEKQLLRLHMSFRPDLWYLNTCVLPAVASIALRQQIPFAVHFHELLSQYNLVGYDELQTMITKAQFTIGCSKGVCANLELMGSKKTQLQYECIDTSAIQPGKEKQLLRAQLGIPEGHKVVVMSGQRSEIKGFDIFIDVARALVNEPIFFLWLGASRQTGYEYFLEQRSKAEGLGNIKIMHPDPGVYYDYLNCADIFFLSSRSDPFPLVMLEAAFLGKRIIALQSGGASEFVNNDFGTVIPSWNISDIADVLLKASRSATHSADAANRAAAFDVRMQAPLFNDLLFHT